MRPLLSVKNITKTFPPVTALHDVSIEVFPGEVHAVVGENGAGKSTLMAVLTGFLKPDTGSGEFRDSQLNFGDPVELKKQGIELVHQHFMLVSNFRVDENLALAEAARLGAPLSLSETIERAKAIANDLGWTIDFSRKTAHLPVGAQQRIEIIKALLSDPAVLVLDEPTAVLSPDEVDNLFGVLRRLRDQGKAIVLIAHKISEVLSVADRVTVLRQGRLIVSKDAKETTAHEIAESMVGGALRDASFARSSRGAVVAKVSDLVIRDDRGVTVVNGLNFELCKGEVFGIGGVDGNGQVELAEVIAGVRTPVSGRLDSSATRIGFVPQDRQTNGLALNLSVLENLAIGALNDAEIVRYGFIRWPQMNARAKALVGRFDIKTPDTGLKALGLSGGNQQKVVVARALASWPDLLVAINPTRGLDFKATQFVQEQIAQAKENGCAVLLVSTDTEELEKLSDKTIFMSRGLFVDRLVGAVT